MRDVKVQEEVFALLTQEYEKAKIQEVKDTPTVEILDEANLPERKSFPRRTQIVVISFVCSLFLGLLLAFFFEYLEKAKENKEEYKEWKDIVETIKSDFKKIRKKKSRK